VLVVDAHVPELDNDTVAPLATLDRVSAPAAAMAEPSVMVGVTTVGAVAFDTLMLRSVTF